MGSPKLITREEGHPSLFVGVSEYKNSDNKEDKIN